MALEKFNAAEVEPRIYEAWEKQGCFEAGANARGGADPYTVMIPPPNVTGVLHIGHAFNNTLQDIMIRWHRMRGFNTLWQPGVDHAGIATQMVVERKLAQENGPSRAVLGRQAFTQKIWEWKAQSGGEIVNQLKRLGASCDWSRTAFTMSGAPDAPPGNEGNFHDAVIQVFVSMYEQGLIYRGKRLVNWDPKFETAISDLEVENIDVAGHMWHFKYPLADGATYTYVEKDEDGQVILEEERDYISIATTRPETMLGDGAVAVHPDDARYSALIGTLCEIPVGPKEHRRLIPIIADEYPDPNFGSGAVKITGAHDFNDYQVARRADLPMYRLMDGQAHMRADGQPHDVAARIAMSVAQGEQQLNEAEIDALNLVPDHLRGLDRFEARAKVIEEITREGLAVMTRADDARLGKSALKSDAEGADALVPLVEAKAIMQPFGDRSKVVIEPMLTDQWFVDTAKIVGPAVDAVRNGEVKIIPESGEKTYYHWLENIEPWCISRQLWWGHQIPVWFDRHGNQYCGANFAEAAEKAREKTGAHRVVEVESAAQAKGQEDDALALYRDPDVLDTWFSSGLWPIGTLGWPDENDPAYQQYFPTSDLITGQDILFFWVARMMMMQLCVVGKIPFKTVYLHGLVRDAKGKKMSKSTGNVIDPLEIIDEYGADALRFTNAAMASLGGALKLDPQRIAGYRNFGTKLWNAASFGMRNGTFDVPHQSAPPPATLAPNQWIKGEVARMREQVDAALDVYRFNDAALSLYSFIWGSFCDWYIELTKPIFEGGDLEAKRETQAVYAWALDQCLIMLHPFMPFITEELWSKRARPSKSTGSSMLIHADWPDYTSADLADAQSDAELGWVIAAIEAVRSARAQMGVPAAAKIPMVVMGLEEDAARAWRANRGAFEKLARVTELTELDAFAKGTVSLSISGGRFGLPLEGIIDVAAESARLEKALGKLAKEIAGLNGRVNNPKFAQSAPEEVVAETRANLAARKEEETKLAEAFARLSELAS